MFGLLAIIGIGVVLGWVSKKLKKLSAWLSKLSGAAPDITNSFSHTGGSVSKAKSHKEILQQNKIAEEQLRSIIGESSNVAYQHDVRAEVEKILQRIDVQG